MTMTTKEDRATIKAAAEKRGARYQITVDGSVHFYGTMPGSNEIRWYFIGWNAAEVAAEIREGRI
jgi:hypothetical protein